MSNKMLIQQTYIHSLTIKQTCTKECVTESSQNGPCEKDSWDNTVKHDKHEIRKKLHKNEILLDTRNLVEPLSSNTWFDLFMFFFDKRKLKTRLRSKRFSADGVCMDSNACPIEKCIQISNSVNKEQGKFA